MEFNEGGHFVNYYDVLKCSRTATSDELKKSFQSLALFYHPDKHINQGLEDSNQNFMLIQKAWTVLRDPHKRKQFDAELSCHENSDYLLYETLNLSELEHNAQEDSYQYSCRCGGTYLVHFSDLVSYTTMVVCDECSFSILIKIPDEKSMTGEMSKS